MSLKDSWNMALEFVIQMKQQFILKNAKCLDAGNSLEPSNTTLDSKDSKGTRSIAEPNGYNFEGLDNQQCDSLNSIGRAREPLRD